MTIDESGNVVPLKTDENGDVVTDASGNPVTATGESVENEKEDSTTSDGTPGAIESQLNPEFASDSATS